MTQSSNFRAQEEHKCWSASMALPKWTFVGRLRILVTCGCPHHQNFELGNRIASENLPWSYLFREESEIMYDYVILCVFVPNQEST